jgi:hypothetical protein
MTPDEYTEQQRERHEAHVWWSKRRSMIEWGKARPCYHCGEWVGHWSGSTPGDPEYRAPCPAIPTDVWLEELRPNCVDVLRHRLGDAIRAATDRKHQ